MLRVNQVSATRGDGRPEWHQCLREERACLQRILL